jgi:hypothetical protein
VTGEGGKESGLSQDAVIGERFIAKGAMEKRTSLRSQSRVSFLAGRETRGQRLKRLGKIRSVNCKATSRRLNAERVRKRLLWRWTGRAHP